MESSGAQQQAMSSINGQLMESDEHQDKRLVRQPEQALKCPRCESSNTKFCYYNNYSLSQPRYFCKGCRRYWTQGGSLRNVPFGGGCRKNSNKRSNSSSSSSSKRPQDQALITADTHIINPLFPNVNLPPLSYNPSDLTLALNILQDPSNNSLLGSPNPIPNGGIGFLDILKGGFVDSANYATGSLFNNGCSFNIGSAFDHVGLISRSETVPQGQFGNSDDDDNNKLYIGTAPMQDSDSNAVDGNSAGDYWNGVGNGYWHGLMHE